MHKLEANTTLSCTYRCINKLNHSFGYLSRNMVLAAEYIMACSFAIRGPIMTHKRNTL